MQKHVFKLSIEMKNLDFLYVTFEVVFKEKCN